MAPTRRAYDKYVPWTAEEDEKLRQLVARYGSARDKCSRWSEHLPGRTAKNCRKRWFYSLDPSIKKSIPWTPDEDARLRDLVARHGQTWSRIARDMDGRTDDQCAARFVNVLSVTDRPWSADEDERLLALQAQLGNKWKEIAASFEGRSPLSCRNRCRKFLRSSSKSRSVASRALDAAPASASASASGSGSGSASGTAPGAGSATTSAPPAAAQMEATRSLTSERTSTPPASPHELPPPGLPPATAAPGPSHLAHPATGAPPLADLGFALHPPPAPQPGQAGGRQQPDLWQLAFDTLGVTPAQEQPALATALHQRGDTMFSTLASAALHAAPESLGAANQAPVPAPTSSLGLPLPPPADPEGLMALLQFFATAPPSSINQLAALGSASIQQTSHPSLPCFPLAPQPGMDLFTPPPQQGRNAMQDVLTPALDVPPSAQDQRATNMLALWGMANQCANQGGASHPGERAVSSSSVCGEACASTLQEQLRQMTPDPAVAQVALAIALQLTGTPGHP